MPKSWMRYGHEWCGLGEYPDQPVVGYLARSAAAMYALHGALFVFISFDVRRYWRLITFMAAVAPLHGIALLVVDLAEGMPTWWTWLEPGFYVYMGVVVLILQYVNDRGTGKRADSADSDR